MLLRDDYPGSVAVEGYGGRQLYHDAVDGTARAAFVQKVVTQEPDAFLSAIGTNDYFAASWTAANFGTAYAALLDALHTARPGMAVYLMSPTPRTTETANGVGSTLANYRTQVLTVCAARSSYCTYIDGAAVTGFNTGTDLADPVHLNTGGNLKVENYLKTFFGL
jgi:lysophospholipase L1-like esterase